MTAPTAPRGFSHVAMITADLDRFRRFYEDVVGLRCVAVMHMNHPPHLRHAAFAAGDVGVLHVFEQPGYDPATDGIVDEIGRRGRVDHFGLLVADEAELAAVAKRLVAAGAADGTVSELGPVLSVHFQDPDGLAAELNCPNPAFDPGDETRDSFLEIDQQDLLRSIAGVPA